MKIIDNIFGKKTDNNTLHIRLKKLDPRAVIPSYAHEGGDVCMDMTAIDVEYDEEKDMYIYHTGLAFEGQPNFGQFLFMRSSNCKTNAYLCNGVGVADPSYRGEIQFRYKNRDSLASQIDILTLSAMTHRLKNAILMTSKNKRVEEISKMESDVADLRGEMITKARNLDFAPYKAGDRVGQMVFMGFPTVTLEVSEELNDTTRGDGGFGSTGN